MICTASAELPDLGADVMVKAQKNAGLGGKNLGKSHGKGENPWMHHESFRP